MKLKKGDKVRIMTGKDKGKEGPVERVWLNEEKVAVTGMNIYKRHMKPRAEGQKGEIVESVRPYPIANLALICPKCKQPTRVGFELAKNGDKTRICRKCGKPV